MTRSFQRLLVMISACSLLACGDDSAEADKSMPQEELDVADSGTLPTDRAPDDVTLFNAWLSEGVYLDWDCQAEPHAALPPSPHGDNRICQNALVTNALAGSGEFPVGATLVKEVYRDGKLDVIAVETRIAMGDPKTSWLYYEARDDEELFSGVGIDVCTGCHAGAPRDYVWSVVE